MNLVLINSLIADYLHNFHCFLNKIIKTHSRHTLPFPIHSFGKKEVGEGISEWLIQKMSNILGQQS